MYYILANTNTARRGMNIKEKLTKRGRKKGKRDNS